MFIYMNTLYSHKRTFSYNENFSLTVRFFRYAQVFSRFRLAFFLIMLEKGPIVQYSTDFVPTVWANYEQVKPLVSEVKFRDITDPILQQVKLHNMEISNLYSVRVAGKPEYKSSGWYLNQALSNAVSSVCARREVVVKLYLDSLPKKSK